MLHSFIKFLLLKQAEKVKKQSLLARENQHLIFRSLMERFQSTDFAKNYGINSLTQYEDFKKKVPVFTYDEIKNWTSRAHLGEVNIIDRGKTPMFSKSSGTTADKSKFIPLSTDGLKKNHVQASIDLTACYYASVPNPGLFKGKLMTVGGSCFKDEKTGIYTGDVSSLTTLHTPWFMQYYRKPDVNTANILNWNEKIEQYALKLQKENITTIAGVPSWTYMILKKLVDVSGKKKVVDVWPHFELFLHGGTAYEPFASRFEELIGAPFKTRNCYNASEGFFAFQDGIEGDMLLATQHALYYEFIPFSAFKKEKFEVVNLDNVERNVDYVLLITSNSGLFRYVIGDVIRFTELNPYRIIISGRIQSVLNLMGEEVMEHQMHKAITEVSGQMGKKPIDYTVFAELNNEGTGKHKWYIELEEHEPEEKKWALQIDSSLKKQNADYEVKRSSDLLLQIPEVIFLKSGSILNWFKQKGKEGGQNKLPKVMSKEDLQILISKKTEDC